MIEKALPVHYQLEIYERSFVNDLTLSFDGTTPFMSFEVGQLFDPQAHGVDLPENHWWKITAVVHRVWQIKTSHIAHQIGLTVVPVPTPE